MQEGKRGRAIVQRTTPGVAFQRGKKDRRRGKGHNECPYFDIVLSRSWLDGYLEALRENTNNRH